MKYQFVPYILFLSVSAGITLFLCIYSSCKVRVTGQIAFSCWMFICSFWSVCNALELMGTTLQAKLFWANMQYSAYSLFPVFLFILILQLTGINQKVNLLTIVVLITIPVITSVLVWFDKKFGLVRYDFVLYKEDSQYSFIIKKYGPWFYVHAIYTYGLFLSALIILIRSVIKQKRKLYKRQQAILMVGLIIVFVPNFLYVMRISPIKRFDITPVFFSVTGFLVLLSMIKYRFLNLIPVAREKVFDNMGEGIVVTDIYGQILDINCRARKMFALVNVNVNGSYIQEILPVLYMNSVTEHLDDSKENEVTSQNDNSIIIYKTNDGSSKYYERNCTPLVDERGEKTVGWIYSTRDITELHNAQEKVWQQQQEIAVSVEQQRVARDLHDNIGQILSFAGVQIQTIERELERGNIELSSQYLSKLKEVTDQSYDELRKYIFNLRQPNMQNISLKEMLTNFVEHFISAFPVECILAIPDSIPEFFESTEIKSHLFSLTKEAVNNSVKHSNASKIEIGIDVSASNKMVYYIKDNGIGIESLENKDGHSSGIRIMEERAILTGGKFSITSEKGRGTKIAIVYEGGKK